MPRREDHGWPQLPIYSEAEAADYAEGCAARWRTAMALPHPLTRAQWDAVQPPELLAVPGPFWKVVIEVFTARAWIPPDLAAIQHLQWYWAWFCPAPTWIEQLEADLRDYDDILAESDTIAADDEDET